jgi:hypothetical protein
MSNKIFFFNISRNEVVQAVRDMCMVHPDAVDKFSISRDENGDGFYLNCPAECPAEWIYSIGFQHGEIIRKNNPFKDKV